MRIRRKVGKWRRNLKTVVSWAVSLILLSDSYVHVSHSHLIWIKISSRCYDINFDEILQSHFLDACKADEDSKEARISPEERRKQIEEEKARRKKERQEVIVHYFRNFWIQSACPDLPNCWVVSVHISLCRGLSGTINWGKTWGMYKNC